MKPKYERPIIVRHSLAGMNKFGVSTAIRPITTIDGVRISELVEAYGSPLFVFSERTLRERVRDLRAQLSRRVPSFDLAWSYKTNYLAAICKVFHQEGSLAEVVSGMEMKMALRAGCSWPTDHLQRAPTRPRRISPSPSRSRCASTSTTSTTWPPPRRLRTAWDCPPRWACA